MTAVSLLNEFGRRFSDMPYFSHEERGGKVIGISIHALLVILILKPLEHQISKVIPFKKEHGTVKKGRFDMLYSFLRPYQKRDFRWHPWYFLFGNGW